MTALLAQLVHTGGKTALVCLHDPALALDSCDILVVLQAAGSRRCCTPEPTRLPCCRQPLPPCMARWSCCPLPTAGADAVWPCCRCEVIP
mgnify:CR=1 FL=1